MIRLFFKNVFFILFFVTIFSIDGFSAKTKVLDHLSAKMEIQETVLKYGVSGSQIFKDFVYANSLLNLSFKYIFCSASFLKKKYTIEKGFSPTFIDDVIEGTASEKDSLLLLKMIYKNYLSDIDKLGKSQCLFPRICEFAPNNYDFYRGLRNADQGDRDPKKNPGLYYVSVVYRDPNAHNSAKLLENLLRDSLRFKPKEKLPFLGDKQKLIDMIFDIGLVKCVLLKYFISGNRQSNISFHFNFYPVENLIYMLRHTRVKDKLINDIIDSSSDCISDDIFTQEVSQFFQKSYNARYYELMIQMQYYMSQFRSADLKIVGLMEMFLNTERVREILANDSIDAQARGLYVVFVSFFVNNQDYQSSLELYVPNYTDFRMQYILHSDKTELIEKIKSEGISQSKIFKEFIDQDNNRMEDVFFTYFFIPKDALDRIFPCGTEDCPSANDFVLGNFNKLQKDFLRKEFYWEYYVDYDIWSKSGQTITCTSQFRHLCPYILELLKKDSVTASMVSNGCPNLESEEGIYLVSAHFKPLDIKPFYPKRRKIKHPPKSWKPNHERLTKRLVPWIDSAGILFRADQDALSRETMRAAEEELGVDLSFRSSVDYQREEEKLIH